MTDDLPQLVQRLRYYADKNSLGDYGLLTDAATAIDTLTRALAHYRTLGEAVAAEREQALSIIATLGIPDTEDQGGHPVPGATRDTLYALRWAARALTAMTQERDAALKLSERQRVALVQYGMEHEEDIVRLVAEQDAAVREARAETEQLRREVNYQRARAVDAEARLAAESVRATAARAGQP